jgi:S1-C subfamily serine protease
VVLRDAREHIVSVALQTAPDTPHNEMVIEGRSPFQGAKISNLSPALADEMRLDPSTEGVVILEVANGSAAQSLGFQRGDLVLSVNDREIGKTSDLERATERPSRLWRITIKRGGQQMSVELRG